MAYDHDVLVETLVYHQRRDAGSCICGWGALGASHPEHVVAMYEASVAARITDGYPTRPVEMNHLNTMGMLMILTPLADKRKLSEPQIETMKKIEEANGYLLAELFFNNRGN